MVGELAIRFYKSLKVHDAVGSLNRFAVLLCCVALDVFWYFTYLKGFLSLFYSSAQPGVSKFWTFVTLVVIVYKMPPGSAAKMYEYEGYIVPPLLRFVRAYVRNTRRIVYSNDSVLRSMSLT